MQLVTCKVNDDHNFARDPLRSYFHEPQKNEIHLLYLHFVFTSFLFVISSPEPKAHKVSL